MIITYNNTIISRTSILGCRLSSHIESFFRKGTLILKDISGRLANSIKIGDPVTIALSEGSSEKIFSFIVISYQKTQEVISGSADALELRLIDEEWYTSQVKSASYSSSFHKIVKDISFEEYPKMTMYLDNTTEVPLTRYRVNKTPYEFFDEIIDKARVQDSPVFLYRDMVGALHLHSWESLSSGQVNFQVKALQETGLKNVKALDLLSFKLVGDAESFDEKYQYIYTSKHVSYLEDAPARVEIPSLHYEESSHTKVHHDKGGPISPWWVSPSDFLSHSYRDALLKDFEVQNATVLIIDASHSNLDVGHRIYLKLYQDNYSGYYVIRGMDYILEKDTFITKLKLVKA